MLHQPPHRKTQTQLVRVSSRLFVINVTFKTVYLRGYVAHACYLRHVVTAVHQIEAGVFSRALYTQPRGANSPEQDRVPSSAVQAIDATSKTIPYGHRNTRRFNCQMCILPTREGTTLTALPSTARLPRRSDTPETIHFLNIH